MPVQQAAQQSATSVSYPGTPSSVPAARRLVREVLAGSPRLDDLELITAELMTNAIRHTPSGRPGGTFTIAVRHSPGWARVEVTDDGDGEWLVPPCEGTAECGRGLAIVTMLADSFGRGAAPAPGAPPAPGAAQGQGQVAWAEVSW